MASGDLYLIQRSIWDEKYPNIEPSKCGLIEDTLFDIPIIRFYSSSDGCDDSDLDTMDPTEQKFEYLNHLKHIIKCQVDGIYKGWKISEKFVLSEKQCAGIWNNEYTLNLPLLKEEIMMLETDPDVLMGEVFQKASAWFFENAEQICCWT